MSRRNATRVELKRKERDELLSSLEDLTREHEAGDLSDEDFERLRRRYVAKTSALVAEIEVEESKVAESAFSERPVATGDPEGQMAEFDGRGAPTPAGRRALSRLRLRLGRRRVRRVLMVLFALWLAVGACLVALHFAGVRLPGQVATGTVSLPEALTVRSELDAAAQAAHKGDIEGAIALYERVLATDSNLPVALANEGWLIRITGLASRRADLVAKGDAEIARAVGLAPNYVDAHAFDAAALAEDSGEYPQAVGQLEQLVAEHPPKSLIEPLRSQFIAIYRHVGLAVPAAIARA